MSCSRCLESGCGGSSGGSCACACADTQLAIPWNRPGLAAVAARLGDYRDFFGEAIARLSDPALPALRDLGTRVLNDPSIAWLDAWAITADVLTFYRERLTNESYLRTVSDEYALRELAALVGFKPRPGVSATVYLAYLMDSAAKPVQVPLLAKAQTTPGPGEQMQTFETGEIFEAHPDWSQMAPRTLRPAGITLIDAMLRPSIRLQGGAMVVRPGERVLFLFDSRPGFQVVREVAAAKADILAGFIELQLKPRLPFDPKDGKARDDAAALLKKLTDLRDKILQTPPVHETANLLDVITSFLVGGTAADSVEGADKAAAGVLSDDTKALFNKILGQFPLMTFNSAKASTLEEVLQATRTLPVAQLASSRQLSRTAAQGLSEGGEDRFALLSATTPELADALPQTLRALPVSPVNQESAPSVFLLRISAGAFGSAAPPKFNGSEFDEEEDYSLDLPDVNYAFLDAAYDSVAADSYVIFDRPLPSKEKTSSRILHIARVRAAQVVMRGSYHISSKATRMDLVKLEHPDQKQPVILEEHGEHEDVSTLRNTIYHAQSEPVTLAPDVDDTEVTGRRIELQTLVYGLHPGQWIVVAGERTDITDINGAVIPGVRVSELAMIDGVTQESDLLAPADTLHTVLTLVKPLAYRYKRSLCIVYGNVVKASHGETVNEVPGSGDASKTLQKFACRRAPLTFTPAATPSGVEGSEVVRVNGVQHQRVDSLWDADGTMRAYQLDLDRGGTAMVGFGDGVHGARLPSGSQNVRVDYRIGIGSPGNARAEQITLLTTRPLGVTGVINPLRASGGADPDGLERIRRNAPLAARALPPLSRLVSVEDYAEFAQRFAGIGHAASKRLSDGAQQIIHVTVAGVDDIPLDLEGDVISNLRAAYAIYGDPAYPVEIGVRELKILVLQAKVGVQSGVSWDVVELDLRARLQDYFSFESRLLGQAAYLSEAIAIMQRTPRVAWVNVDIFGAVTEYDVRDAKSLAAAIGSLGLSPRVDARSAGLNPNWSPGSVKPRFLEQQLVFLVPEVSGLVALNQV